jgi:hypothetical protein
VSGTPDVKNVQDAEAGYARMDQSRLRSLVEEFGADYGVFRKPFDVRRIDAEIVFENAGFLVVRTCMDSGKDCGRWT